MFFKRHSTPCQDSYIGKAWSLLPNPGMKGNGPQIHYQTIVGTALNGRKQKTFVVRCKQQQHLIIT